MNIIAAGYSGTGSSAIIHLLSEYDGMSVAVNGSYEHVLFYMPDGLFDLEDRLLLNNSIHMFDGAINRFYKAMVRLNDNNYGWFGGYKKRFGDSFLRIVDEFIDELTQYKAAGYWSDDFILKRSPVAVLKDTAKLLCGRQVNQFGYATLFKGDGIVRFGFLDEEQFYAAARKFVKAYFDLFQKGNDNLLWDQVMLPQNLYRLNHYFENTKVIVFDRDPRDMYVLSKYIWPQICGSANLFPTDPENFSRFYAALRKNERCDNNECILRLHFEDLVYYYDTTVEMIEKFLGVNPEAHVRIREKFKPDQSIKNTQNFLMDENWINEIQVIEKRLQDYLYNFPYRIQTSIDETSDPA